MRHRRRPVASLLVRMKLWIGLLCSIAVMTCAPVWAGELASDLGDAPDSTNHHSTDAPAYDSGTLGRFPTVWESTDGPSGPKHDNGLPIRLGLRVSGESDADLFPDDDGQTNILGGGTDQTRDRDAQDDGWFNTGVGFLNCQQTTLNVRVSWDESLSAQDSLYVNAWYDGNRDGDWADTFDCGLSDATEWIIRDVEMASPSMQTGQAGFADIELVTERVYNADGDTTAWLRLTISEQPVSPLSQSLADGRGPAAPETFAFGETEDYRTGGPAATSSDVSVTMTAENSFVSPAGEIGYRVVMANALPFPVADVSLQSFIPQGTQYVPGSLSFTAPSGSYNAAEQAIRWNGTIPAGGSVTMDFEVRVDDNAACGTQIYGDTVLTTDINELVRDIAQVPVSCPGVPTVGISKSAAESNVDRGDPIDYTLTIENASATDWAASVVDAIPDGTEYIAGSARADNATIFFASANDEIEWQGVISANNTLDIQFSVRALPELDCGAQISSSASVKAGDVEETSPEVLVTNVCETPIFSDGFEG